MSKGRTRHLTVYRRKESTAVTPDQRYKRTQSIFSELAQVAAATQRADARAKKEKEEPCKPAD